jgi:peptide/nickel transport system substrate-binding protein
VAVRSHHDRWRHATPVRVGAVLAAGALGLALLSACGSGKKSAAPPTGGAVNASVTIDNESGGPWTCAFNPMNLSYTFLSEGIIYETLDFVNALQNAKVTPMLASAYQWSNNNKTLTFTIRSGVTFNNGTPFSASDVVYTFDLAKRVPVLDLNSVWSVLSSVTQQGNQVVFQFKTPAVPYFYYIAGQVPIVSQAAYSQVAHPDTYTDPRPVATGPYMIGSCTPQNITYVKNPHYWQPGLPKVQTVQYPAFTSNDTANNFLAQGLAQWGSQYIPGIKSFYLDKSPDNHYWFPPLANVTLFPNLTNPLLKQLPVRQAISEAIDRNKVGLIGESGYEDASNQAGITTPTFSEWLNHSLLSKYDFSYNPNKAIQTLESAGFTRSGGGLFRSPDGKELNFSVINLEGYSDWAASLEVVAQELRAVGIGLTVQTLSSTQFDNEMFNGQYQFAYYGETGGPAPYYELRQWLYGPNSAPIGQAAASNFERYESASTDALINQYAATTSTSEQHSIIDQLATVMLTQVPVIPVTEAALWYQYNTSHLTGWPTQANPYAQPAAFQYPDIGQVLLHLQPK